MASIIAFTVLVTTLCLGGLLFIVGDGIEAKTTIKARSPKEARPLLSNCSQLRYDCRYPRARIEP